MTEIQIGNIEGSASRKMTTTWHQQVFALDAKYNTLRANKLPSLGMLRFAHITLINGTILITFEFSR